MIITIPTISYANDLKAYSNECVSGSLVFSPFGFTWPSQPSSFLLIGHLVEEIVTCPKKNYVDPLDIAIVAWELGYSQLESFFEDGPTFLCKLALRGGKNLIAKCDA